MKKYSQEKLIEAFKRGDISGEKNIPKHIETVISNVFLFKDRAYKIYKNDSKYWNDNFQDNSIKKNRFGFTKKDFEWNKTLSKEIYLDLKGVKFFSDKIKFVSFNLAEDLVIVMKRFKEDSLLSSWLLNNDLRKGDFSKIGKQLGDIMNDLPGKIDKNRDLIEIMLSRKKDVEGWVRELENKYISSKIINKLFKILDNEFKNYQKSIIVERNKKGICPDVHLENLIYKDGKIFIVDSYSPKEEWQTADVLVNFYRVGADVYMLAGRKAFREFKRGYILSKSYLDDKNENFFLLYASLIDWPYLYMLGEKDPNKIKLAKKYGDSVIKKYL